MKRLTIISLLCSLPLGCGTSIPGFPDTRLEVNEGLRAQCPYFTDQFIHASLSIAETDRQAGVSKHDDLGSAIAGCMQGCDQACQQAPNCTVTISAQCSASCLICFTAIVDQVYGP